MVKDRLLHTTYTCIEVMINLYIKTFGSLLNFKKNITFKYDSLMHNTHFKGQLLLAIQSFFGHCPVSHQMWWRHTVQAHNSLRELCYFCFSTFAFAGFAEALSRSSNGFALTTTADVIRCRCTIACENCVISIIQLLSLLGSLTPLSRSSNGIAQTTTAPQIHHHSPCGALIGRWAGYIMPCSENYI